MISLYRNATCSRSRRAADSASAAARRAADTSGALAAALPLPSPNAADDDADDDDDALGPLASTPRAFVADVESSVAPEARRAPPLRARIAERSEARVCCRLDDVLTAPDTEFA